MKTNYRKFLIPFLSLGVIGMLFFMACSVDDGEDSFNPKGTNKFNADKANTLIGQNSTYAKNGYTVGYANTCTVDVDTNLASQTYIYMKPGTASDINDALQSATVPNGNATHIIAPTTKAVGNYTSHYDIEQVTYTLPDCESTMPLAKQVVSARGEVVVSNSTDTSKNLPSGATGAMGLNMYIYDFQITPYSGTGDTSNPGVREGLQYTRNPIYASQDGWVANGTKLNGAEAFVHATLQLISQNTTIDLSTNKTIQATINAGWDQVQSTWAASGVTVKELVYDENIIPRALTTFGAAEYGKCGITPTSWKETGSTTDIPIGGEGTCSFLSSGVCNSLNKTVISAQSYPTGNKILDGTMNGTYSGVCNRIKSMNATTLNSTTGGSTGTLLGHQYLTNVVKLSTSANATEDCNWGGFSSSNKTAFFADAVLSGGVATAWGSSNNNGNGTFGKILDLAKSSVGGPGNLGNATACKTFCDYHTQAYISYGGLTSCSSLPIRYDKIYLGQFQKFQFGVAYNADAAYVNDVTDATLSVQGQTNKRVTIFGKANRIWLSTDTDTAKIQGNGSVVSGTDDTNFSDTWEDNAVYKRLKGF